VDVKVDEVAVGARVSGSLGHWPMVTALSRSRSQYLQREPQELLDLCRPSGRHAATHEIVDRNVYRS
jgi:hypothetical protein